MNIRCKFFPLHYTNKRVSYLLFLVFFFTSLILSGQDGSLDVSFNSSDKGNGFGDGPNSSTSALSVCPDGKIIIAGQFTSYSKIPLNLARLNVDGTLDTTFKSGSGGASINSVSVQKDGKVIIAGSFTKFNGINANYIIRLNPNGSLDNSFNVLNISSPVLTTAIQNDGKILVGGTFYAYNNKLVNNIIRLNEDGSFDNTFKGGVITTNVQKVHIQADGKILYMRQYDDYSPNIGAYLARLNMDGTIDKSFKECWINDGSLKDFTVQKSGKIILVGNFKSIANSTSSANASFIARLDQEGNYDSDFQPSTTNVMEFTSVKIQSNEKIIICGNFENYGGIGIKNMIRLNENGSLDNTFGSIQGPSANVFKMVIQDNDDIIITGNFLSYNTISRNFLARIKSDGKLDNSFLTNTGLNNWASRIKQQKDNKLIIGGAFGLYNGSSSNYLARLNEDGTLDSSFKIGIGPSYYVNALALQKDEKILIGGSFKYYNGKPTTHLARLNKDGTLDTMFKVKAWDTVYDLAIQDDGKIIVGGVFKSFNGIQKFNDLVRLHQDGSLDTTFFAPTGSNVPSATPTFIYCINIQKNGQIIVGGNFSKKIARLNKDGSYDSTFKVGEGAIGSIYQIVVQEDGKIIIGGRLSKYNNVAVSNIARLNLDGSLDTSFKAQANDAIQSLTLQKDKKLIVGGYFKIFNALPVKYLTRLNENGTIDVSFNVSQGPDNWVSSSFIQNDGRIVVSGSFTNYSGVGKNRIARLHNNSLITDFEKGDITFFKNVSIYPNPNNGDFILNLNQRQLFSLYNSCGQVLKTFMLDQGQNNITWSEMENGLYILKSHTPTPESHKIIIAK
jgi:uncharacterized delta-60 repeat protein